MKNIATILLLFVGVLSCKNNNASQETAYNPEDLITMRGEFIFIDNAAVLQTQVDIYGVVIDDMAKQLNKAIKPYQTEATDMVPVTVKVLKYEKPADEEGWPYRVEIKEILKVEEPNPNTNNIIKLGN